MNTPATLHLGSLKAGQSGHIVGYESTHHAYREKLLSMGLTPGTHFHRHPASPPWATRLRLKCAATS